MFISLLALLCGCSSRRAVVSSSERYTADSLAMGSQFVLDSVWRDSCTIVQTIIEFETDPESGLTVADGEAVCHACCSPMPGSTCPVSNEIKRIVRTEVRRGAAGEVHAERSDSTVNVKEILENSTSNEQTYNRIYDNFLLPLFLIFLISLVVFIWVITRKAGP